MAHASALLVTELLRKTPALLRREEDGTEEGGEHRQSLRLPIVWKPARSYPRERR